MYSGKIRGSLSETWMKVDANLEKGGRGLEGRTSLAKLLAEKRGVRNIYSKPRLSKPQILKWVDAYHRRTGKWPLRTSGSVPEASGETWINIDNALLMRLRGLDEPHSSLARLLANERGVRNMADLPRLRVAQILEWADNHYKRTEKWPNARSGAVAETPGETWKIIDGALQKGRRGFRGKSSLAQVLAQHRGKRHHLNRPPLTVTKILEWADQHHRRTGVWPGISRYFGPVVDAPGERWRQINRDLTLGLRGLRGRTTLNHLLAKHRDVRHQHAQPQLTVKQILEWADLHHERTGKWPDQHDGSVISTPGEKWSTINMLLQKGRRGLPGKDTLARFLARHRGFVKRPNTKSPLSVAQILAWADSHHRQTGKWPTARSGPVREARAESWNNVSYALNRGTRGLPCGQSLPRLLAEHRGLKNQGALPPLNVKRIVAWARAYHERTGRWPSTKSGAVHGVPGETWITINHALIRGRRGMAGGLSLPKFLERHCGKKYSPAPPALTVDQILTWADQHRRRTGAWPKDEEYAQPIPESPGENWRMIDRDLRLGRRGLPRRMTLKKLLARHRGMRYKPALPRLTVHQILRWADMDHKKTGHWPDTYAGAVLSAPGETWNRIAASLRLGGRGLPPNGSLPRLLAKHRGVQKTRRQNQNADSTD